METVNAYEVIIPAFGMFIRRKMRITCGKCRRIFEDKPYPQKEIISTCPYCGTNNKLPLTKA
jgi:rRNA maturation endonuclease Nob1